MDLSAGPVYEMVTWTSSHPAWRALDQDMPCAGVCMKEALARFHETIKDACAARNVG